MNSEETFVKLIKENELIIFKISSIYTNDTEEKRDLYQEIIFQLWRGFQKFRAEAKPSTWIYRVALNTAISRIRQEKKKLESVPLDKQNLLLPDDFDDPLKERVNQLYQQIAKLNDLEKAIVLLYLEDKPHSEIAEITGLSVSNVGTRFSRIKEKLRKEMTKID